ncbi:MAG: hypothetical protein M3081_19265 [Gemmatimonadota bacterium]|nr:hypothetical protein [Gemmatimonadota bacterium]
MRIHGKSAEIQQPKTAPAESVKPSVAPSVSSERPAASRNREDRVQISDAGRAKAAETTGLDPQRVTDVRRKVLEGAYNSVNVVDTVARRILEQGDV